MYWKITPHHHNNDYDYCVMPGNTQEDHRAALEYAQDRLEEEWSQASPGETTNPVIMERCEGNVDEENL
jgi:hypothetical protein